MRFLTQLTPTEDEVLTRLVAAELGVDLEEVPAGFTCAYFAGSASPVVITWEGRSTMDPATFDQLVATARDQADDDVEGAG